MVPIESLFESPCIHNGFMDRKGERFEFLFQFFDCFATSVCTRICIYRYIIGSLHAYSAVELGVCEVKMLAIT